MITNSYFEGFPQVKICIQAANNSSDGFKLPYCILEIIYPQLRAPKGGINKTIEPLSYNDIDDGSIYPFITRYKNYLVYELLSPEKRHYNKREQALFVVQALKVNNRFQPGIEYITSTLLVHQRELRMYTATPFPLDLGIDDIRVTIDEQCPSYVVE